MNGMSNMNAKITAKRKIVPQKAPDVLILTQIGENS